MVSVKVQVVEQILVVMMVRDLMMVEVKDKDFEWMMVKGKSSR